MIAPPASQTVTGLPPVSAVCISSATAIAPPAIGRRPAAIPRCGRTRAVAG